MTTPEPKKRGRPKKVVEAQKEINPDCKPATRGYVKCLLRTMCDKSEHAHYDNYCGDSFRLNLAAMMAFVFLASLAWGITSSEQWVHSTALSLCIMSLVIGVTCVLTDGRVSSSQVYRDYPEAIQKYTPPTPVCEKRKECE